VSSLSSTTIRLITNKILVHLPRRGDHAIPFRDFAPKAWAAICELSGGEQHILTEDKVMPPPMDEPVPQAVMNDSFIIALGNASLEKQWQEAGQHANDEGETARPDGLTSAQAKLLDPYARNNYHVDGDFFHHFLDSPEQGLLPIVLFSDVKVGGGGTYIVPDAIPIMAKHLYSHPEGVMPDMSVVKDVPGPKKEFDHGFYQNAIKTIPREKFVTATGKAGDVYLLHPLMVHSGVPNFLRGEYHNSKKAQHTYQVSTNNTRTTHHHKSSCGASTAFQLRQTGR